MSGIWFVTLSRLREPAFVMIFLVGCVMSYLFAGVGTFELTSVAAAEEVAAVDPASADILLGTVLLTVLGMLITVFIAASEVPRDITSRMIAIYMSKPVSRGGYIFGKFLGSLSIGLVFSVIWLTVMMVVRYKFRDITEHPTPGSLLNQYLCLLMLVPTCAVSISISCFFSDVIAMVLTCIYVLSSFVVALIPFVIRILDDDLMTKIVLLPPYYLMPNLSYYVRVNGTIMEFVALAVYTVCTSGIFLLIGRWRFNRGDIFDRG